VAPEIAQILPNQQHHGVHVKNLFALLITLAAGCACSSTANAGIVAAWWNSTGNSGIAHNSGTFSASSDLLTLGGNQMSDPAQIGGQINTSGPVDPTLTIGSAVNNDSGVAWTSYQVNVVMNNPFTFTTPGTTVANPTANDWIISATIAPTLQASGPFVGLYEGTLDFTSGTPVAINGELDFSYSINFAGSTHYTFTQDMIANFASAPEPRQFALAAGLGGLLLAFCLPRKSETH
jgi:hypothetical protein